MFNMQKIGRKISELRKGKNMTQPELADRMGISFQAVSNWERGNSMPDIAKLPELAEILGVSVDELLGEKSALVEAALNNNVEEVIESQSASAEEISNVLSILKPDQASAVAKKCSKTGLASIEHFLPYMDDEDISELAFATLENGEDVDEFLKYMDDEDIRDLAFAALEKGKPVENFLIYMDDEDVGDLASAVLEKGGNVEAFLKYMDDEDVSELAFAALAKGENVEMFLPYMDEDDVGELAMKALKWQKRK